MNDFKVGDRVAYKGSHAFRAPSLEGARGTVRDFSSTGGVLVNWDDGTQRWGVLAENLRHIETPRPDAITINRADLPEVKAEGDAVVILRGNGCIYTANHSPESARNSALDFLALAEFLEAREKVAEEAKAAEKEAVALLNKRRDVMAREMYLEAFGKDDGISYRNRNLLTQLCIDRIIELEDAAK